MATWNNIKWYIDEKIKKISKKLNDTDGRLKRIEEKLERVEGYNLEMKEQDKYV